MSKKQEFKANKLKVNNTLNRIMGLINEARLNPLEALETLSMTTVVFVEKMRRDNLVEDIDEDVLERFYLTRLKMYSLQGVNFKDYVTLEHVSREQQALPIVVRLMGLVRSGKITSMTRNIDVMRMVMAVDKEASWRSLSKSL